MIPLLSISVEKYLRQNTKESVLTELCNYESRQGNDKKVKR